jgi:hypothetical protein
MIESLEDRRLMSVAIGTIAVTSAVAGVPANTEVRNARATFTAQGVAASAGDRATSVTYFIDTNRNSAFDRGDVLIGRSRKARSEFAVIRRISRKAALETSTISAIAHGKLGRTDVSPAVSQTIAVQDAAPTIQKLSGSRKVIAHRRAVPASPVVVVPPYLDANGDGLMNADETLPGSGASPGETGTWQINASDVVGSALQGGAAQFLGQAPAGSDIISSIFP